ncbi:S-adenosylmethionine synthase [Methyloligella halotolerans]|uniref:S-adenosylmethionine synthase n=1 Tax=Methyloligella halotolerans TaxID=1177755 RepID=A0A1E2RVV4_9HYPH|nr:methionine adenosyltransferase [Methyloligella halotolerans]ODA66367.1 S-adenosylmethionine synthase [Methyloligella halotolerans]
MSRQDYVFTSESVSEGHPDKVCDRISDAVVDLYLGADPQARVAVETLVTTNRIVMAGEVRGPESITPQAIEDAARECIKNIGYEQDGFHWRDAEFEFYVHEQSADIAMGVDADADKEKDEGAGDQGIMFGYACQETEPLMPAPIYYAHSILHEMAKARHAGNAPELGPDAKSQVTLNYVNGEPKRVNSVVVSTQHSEDATQERVREIVMEIVNENLPKGWIDSDTKFYVNPTGRFVIGGPDGDTGLTGRKIIVDTYGGMAPHGGGAFSGKDPTKVDRSAAYAARYLAKNIVAAGLADRCTLQLSYAIGVSQPLSIFADLHGTGKVAEDKVENAIREVMDLSPRGIREHLSLNRPVYERTAAYGHFGRTPDNDGGFSWEKLDLVEPLKAHMS